MSAYADYSDPLLRFAFWSGVGATVLSLLLLAWTLVLRVFAARARRREARVVARWRPILIEAALGETVALPLLAARDRMSFLRLWMGLHESVRGEAADGLRAVARGLRLHLIVRLWLDRGLARRLIAGEALGMLREDSAWEDLSALATSAHPLVSVVAARAALRIAPERTLERMFPAWVLRRDWPMSSLMGMLDEAGPDRVTPPLLRSLHEAAAIGTNEGLPRLIRCLPVAHWHEALPLLRTLLARSADVDVLIACLRAIGEAQDADAVRPLLTNAAWAVRVQAARTLGQIGTAADAPALTALLSDPVWWVRLRAAEALDALPGAARDRLPALLAEHPDRYARDAVTEVLARRRLRGSAAA